MPSFAQRFKQPLHSDCELVLRLQTLANADEDRAAKRARLAAQDQASRTSPEVLAAFPAHRLVLCSSNYFEAQVSYMGIDHASQHMYCRFVVTSVTRLPFPHAYTLSVFILQQHCVFGWAELAADSVTCRNATT